MTAAAYEELIEVHASDPVAYREFLKSSRLEAAGVSRIAPPAEKILAVANIFRALVTELGEDVEIEDVRLQVTMLDIAGRIAMGTDTRDMGIIGAPPNLFDPNAGPA